jgi:alpha-methylacyl-CoA racemase
MRPLEGLTVLDLTRLLPGPYAAWLLRSWGARVIKVEDRGAGDYLRSANPAWFAFLNSGAESLAVDLKRPEGRDLLLGLLPRVDLVLEGFRPGVMERLGLGWAALQRANPRLVLLSLAGWGEAGSLLGGTASPDLPAPERAGHDLTYLARTGLLALTAEVPMLPLADLSGGMLAAAGALAAVLQAHRTGRGSHVQTSLFDGAQALGAIYLAEAMTGAVPTRQTMALGGAAPCYSLYETQDGGRVALGALEPKFWAAFCEAVNRFDWVARGFDPGLRPEVQALFASQPLAYWAHLGRTVDCCLEPVRGLGEAAAALEDRGRLQPVCFDGGRPSATGPAPAQGADSAAVLRSLGVPAEAVAHLQRLDVIP